MPESQYGFHKGRGCMDMVFTVRQLVEKTIEHRSKLFLLFSDLKKAYDLVPRAMMWHALEKLEVPHTLVELAQLFLEGMKAWIRVNGELLEEINVHNGQTQGCTMAPTLFNLYSCLVVDLWNEKGANIDGVSSYM